MKKRNKGGGGASWMDTYGDMVTLLLCFFVLLYSMSTISEDKWKALVQSFNPNAVPTMMDPQGNDGPSADEQQVEAGENLQLGEDKILEQEKIDLIILAGFMSILSENFTSRFPERILNVHPSLIPSFCGKGFYGLRVHEAALAYGVKVTGATVHFVNEIPDGGRILLQQAVSVLPGDTPETLQKRVMEQAEWKLLPQAAEMVAAEIVKGRAE